MRPNWFLCQYCATSAGGEPRDDAVADANEADGEGGAQRRGVQHQQHDAHTHPFGEHACAPTPTRAAAK